ncbi:glycosyl hydrolase family 28-related protein [Actinomadura nitritigenes]|uniref:glycosyl hydrolase family 28-related protein n=1 Tax=Actinomadura nitritigenes TaxID=134602 RepID=UPI003D8D1CCD
MINVRDTGALGDGVADDAPAIQAAFDEGGWVYVPDGTYRLASLPLRTKGRARLTLSPGATLLRAAPEIMLTNTPLVTSDGGYGGPGGILIEGGVWDVNGVAQPEYSAAFAFGHGEDITLRDLTVLDTPGWHAAEFNACKDVKVRDSRFAGFVHDGDRGFSEAIQLDAMTSAAAYPLGGPYDSTPCWNVSVKGCWFGGSGTPGSQAWPRGIGSHNGGSGPHSGIDLVGNRFEGVTDAAIRSYEWANATITGNRVGSSGGEGIVARDGSYYIDILGNQVFDSGRTGIWVSHNCGQISIRENTVVGSGKSVNDTHYGIRASDNCDLLAITGNRVRRRATGPHAKYGLSLTNTCTHVQRYGNDLRVSGVSGNLQDESVSPIANGVDAA